MRPGLTDDPRLDLFKVLGDNTRFAIHVELARSPRPLTTAEIADLVGLHPNTVRPHLDRMREVGLVAVEVGGRGEVGRPQHRWAIAAGVPSLDPEPRVMPVLAGMVLTMAERLGASADDAEAVGREEGSRRAVSYSSAPSALESIVSDLDRLGFEPVVSDGGDGSAVVSFAQCPFGDLVDRHPELVCSLHRGLVDGLVTGSGDAELVEFCSASHRTPCRATFR